jgi:hypothetical protein
MRRGGTLYSPCAFPTALFREFSRSHSGSRGCRHAFMHAGRKCVRPKAYGYIGHADCPHLEKSRSFR